VGRSVSTTALAVIVAAVVAASVAGGLSYYISSHRPATITTVYKTVTQTSSTGTSSTTTTVTATTTTITYTATNLSTSCAVSVSTFLVNDQQIEVPAGGTYEYTFSIQYPGSINVMILDSSTNDIYVEISGVAINGMSYSSGQVIVGEFGSVWYDVFPGTVHIYIGNGNLTSEAYVTLSIYYSSNC